jgi:hypothetical protein
MRPQIERDNLLGSTVSGTLHSKVGNPEQLAIKTLCIDLYRR